MTFKEVEDIFDFQRIDKLARMIFFGVYSDYINPEHIDYFLRTYQNAKAIQNQISQQSYRYFLIQLNDSTIGYIGLQSEAPTLFLSKFYLINEYRKKGFGLKAIKFIDKLAQKGSYNKIELIVNNNNKAAIAFYKKYGFKIIDEIENSFANGYTMQDLLLRKKLL